MNTHLVDPNADILIYDHLYLRTFVSIMYIDKCHYHKLSQMPIIYQWKKMKMVTHNDFNTYFQYACAQGFLQFSKIIYKQYTININSNLSKAFVQACSGGHLHIAQWLYSLGVKTNTRSDQAFRLACRNDHIDIVKWFVHLTESKVMSFNSKHSIIYGNNEWAFIHSVGNSCLSVVEFLLEKSQQYGRTFVQIPKALKYCCWGGDKADSTLFGQLLDKHGVGIDLLSPCYSNNCLNLAKILVDHNTKHNFTTYANFNFYTKNIINFEFYVWIYDLTIAGKIVVDISQDYHIFCRLCLSGNMDKLSQYMNLDNKYLANKPFLGSEIFSLARSVCHTGNYEMAKYLFDLYEKNNLEKSKMFIDFTFKDIAKRSLGSLIPIMSMLLELENKGYGKIDVDDIITMEAESERVFCENPHIFFIDNNIDFLEYMATLINPYKLIKLCYVNSYRYIYKIAWIKDIMTNIYDDYTCKNTYYGFLDCCKHNDLEVAKWILTLNQGKIFDIHLEYYEPFVICCRNDSVEMAQWIYNLEKRGYGKIPSEVLNQLVKELKKCQFPLYTKYRHIHLHSKQISKQKLKYNEMIKWLTLMIENN